MPPKPSKPVEGMRNYKLVDPTAGTEWLCVVCHTPVKDGLYIPCGRGHFCCAHCISKIPTQKSNFGRGRPMCPQCKIVIDPLRCGNIPSALQKQADEVKVKCASATVDPITKKSISCSWQGKFVDSVKHVCDIGCPTCGDAVRPEELTSGVHKRYCRLGLNDCPRKKYGCKESVTLNKVTEHEEKCKFFICDNFYQNPEDNTICTFTGTKSDVKKHLDTGCRKLHELIRAQQERIAQLEGHISQGTGGDGGAHWDLYGGDHGKGSGHWEGVNWGGHGGHGAHHGHGGHGGSGPWAW